MSSVRAPSRDMLLLALFAAVGLPLAPDVEMGPYGAINPQRLVRLVVVLGIVSAAAHLSRRWLGARFGLVASGFAGGFISSSATIGAMGLRAYDAPEEVPAAVAGGLASSIATVLLYVILVATVDPELVPALALPLGAAFAAAVGTTWWFARSMGTSTQAEPNGVAFSILPAILFALGVAVVSILAAGLDEWVGERGIYAASAVAAIVDAHATTGTIASLHHESRISERGALVAISIALTTNTGTKIAMGWLSRCPAYATRLAAGVLAIAAACWAGFGLRVMLG